MILLTVPLLPLLDHAKHLFLKIFKEKNILGQFLAQVINQCLISYASSHSILGQIFEAKVHLNDLNYVKRNMF